MQIDIHVASFTSSHDNQRYQATTMLGIFKVDKDSADNQRHKLTWCFAMPGDDRPKDFSAKPGSNHKLINLERFDETEAIAEIRKSKGRTLRDSQGRWIKSAVLDTPTPEAVTALKSLRRLKTLSLGVADEHVAEQLSWHQTLQELRFKCDVPAEVLDKLIGSLPKLEKLHFSCTEFTDAHGEAIAKSKSLKTLFLSQNSGDYNGFRKLKKSSIDTLRIDLSEFPLSSIDLIGSSLANLRNMKFYECSFSNENLIAVNHLNHIDTVELAYCQIDDEGSEYLATLPNLSKLKINYKSPAYIRAAQRKAE